MSGSGADADHEESSRTSGADLAAKDLTVGAPPSLESKGILRELAGLPAGVVIGMVRGYQIFLSPIFGGRCRFHPSCSEYFIQAVRKYGVISGSLRGMWRIMRCQPLCKGGYDPP